MKVLVSEEVQAIILLNSLPSQYNSLKYGRKMLTLKDVVADARSKERELKESYVSNKNGEAFMTRRRPERRDNFNKKFKNRSRSRSGSRVSCWYCKKEGHVKKDWFARKKRMKSEAHGEAAIMVDKIQEIEALSISKTSPKDRWIIDSGCSYHMTSRRDWFESFTDLTNGQVLLADDRSVNV